MATRAATNRTIIPQYMIHIADYLHEPLVFFLDAKSRDEAIQSLIDSAAAGQIIANPREFFEAIIRRESIVSTGIGIGVALPHAKLEQFNDFFIVIGILQNGVEWNSLDGAPVRVIFLIGGPDDRQTEYLQILSVLTQAIKDEARRKKMLTLKSPKELIELFKE